MKLKIPGIFEIIETVVTVCWENSKSLLLVGKKTYLLEVIQSVQAINNKSLCMLGFRKGILY
jgi:hypothetical protein